MKKKAKVKNPKPDKQTTLYLQCAQTYGTRFIGLTERHMKQYHDAEMEAAKCEAYLKKAKI